MTESEFNERQAVVAEALSWHQTPYHHAARVKGQGVDCAWFLADSFAAAGLISRIEMENYPPDWHMHKNDERYLRKVLEYADKIDACPAPLPGGEACKNGPCAKCAIPLPGDIAMYKFGRCTAHGAIIIRWPRLIHPVIGIGVEIGEAFSAQLEETFQGIYRLGGWDR